MKQIPVSDLLPGMVTAENILNYDLKIIVPKGVILTENIISRLDNYSVFYVRINDELEATGNGFLQANTPFVKRSAEFSYFYEKYKILESKFGDAVMGAYLYGNNLIHQNFVAECLELFWENDLQISLFDMLLAINNENDSIFAHCINVGLISHELAKWLNFSEEDQVMACACGMFHDVGKVAIPPSILRKPDKLTDSEFSIIKTHTTEGYHLLQRIGNFPKPVMNAALMHHEKCDNSGYPYQVGAEELDKFTKIVTISDIFDAMTNDRVYRKAMCPFTVIRHFEDNGLHKYEPQYLLTFLENVSNSYLNHHVTLSNGLEGDVVFINKDSFSKPVIKTANDELINLQESYYQNILNLAGRKNISIESII